MDAELIKSIIVMTDKQTKPNKHRQSTEKLTELHIRKCRPVYQLFWLSNSKLNVITLSKYSMQVVIGINQ